MLASHAPAAENLGRWRWLVLIPASLLLALGAGLLAAQQPLLAVATMSAAVLGTAVIVWPDAAILVVVFLLYSNAAVVAVRFHGLPFVVGAAFPLLLFIPLAIALLGRRQKLLSHPAVPLAIAFGLVQLLGALFARDLSAAMAALSDFLLEGLLIYLLIINVVRTEKTLRRVTWVLLLAGALLTLVPLHQQLTDNYDSIYGGFAQLSETAFRTGEESLQGEVRQFRSSGAIGEQNRFGQIMLMLVPLGLLLFLGERSVMRQGAAVLATGLTLGGVALSFSRGAAVGFVLLLVAMLLMRIIRLSHFLLIALLGVVILVALPQYQTRLLTLSGVSDVVSDSGSAETDSSIEGRATEMAAAALVFVDHPILGVGPGMFRFYSQEYGNRLGIRHLDEQREAHSLYLDIAANHGLLGLVTFFGIFAVTLRDLARAGRRWRNHRPALAALAAGYFLALIAYLATGLFLHLSYARYLWLMLGLAAAAGNIANRLPLEDAEAVPAEPALAAATQPEYRSV